MGKGFKQYLITWVILVLMFNVVVFAARPIIPGYVINYDARFWISWSFVIISFIVNLFCAYNALKQENIKKLFYKVSLITTSRTGLIITTILGIVLMLIPDCPYWISIILCTIVSGLTLISISKADLAGETIEEIDKKVKADTFFIKSLTVETQTLISNANSEEAKNICKKIYETVRYSDPVSNALLNDIENEITDKLEKFKIQLKKGICDEELSNEIINLVKERNNKCKAFK